MVEKMKRLDLLMARTDADAYLDDLQDIGVVHLVDRGIADDPGLLALESRISSLRKTSRELHRINEQDEDHPKNSVEQISDVEELLERVKDVQGEIHRIQTERDSVRRDMAVLEPWGRFDGELVRKLKDAGVWITHHIAPAKVFAAADLEGRHIEIVREISSKLYFVELRHGRSDDAMPLFAEERIPTRDPAELQDALEELDVRQETANRKLSVYALQRDLIDRLIVELESSYERRMASLSLEEEGDGEIRMLSGYVPISLRDTVETFLRERSILPVFRDPELTENTPIRLKNGPVARLFEPITRIFGLPQYVEIDTTPFLAPFFAFFFGICLADVGYGILVSLGTLAAAVVAKKKSIRSVALLGFILGLMTVVGGLFFNTVFGVQIDGIPALPETVRNLLLFTNLNDGMAFAIALGVLQILVGFVMQVINKIRQEGPLGGLQPAGTFIFFAGVVITGVASFVGKEFSIGPIPVGRWLHFGGLGSILGLTAIIVGVGVILLFNNHQRALWIRPFTGLWEMYNIVSGLLGDVLSYIRLFALALAGGLLGGAINLIAGMIRGDDPGLLSWFFMILVLVGGHLINFALAALGAFVHPLRLTFVEFYKSVGFTGGGQAYAPYGGKTS